MATNRIPPDEFMPHAPTELGAQVNAYHCKKGKDNDRLYIKRNYDGSVVAYCHHCGGHGFHRGTSTTPVLVLKNKKHDLNDGVATEPYVPELHLPSNASIDWKDWPVEAIEWITKYGITQEETRRYGIVAVNFGDTGGYCCLPVYDDDSELVFYQRRFFGEAAVGRSKYDTCYRRTSGGKAYHGRSSKGKAEGRVLFRSWCDDPINSGAGSTVCIVEDKLSAIKVGRYADAVALGNASIDDGNLLKLVSEYDNFLIFLDHDNPQVIKNELKIKRRLDLVARGVVKYIKADRDPKEHTDEELQELLKL